MQKLFSRRRLIAAGGIAAVAMPASLSPHVATAAAAGGMLQTLREPIRVFDSREASSVLGGAKFATGDNVAVAVSAGYDGFDFALAVFVNITITQTEGAGYLTVRGDDLSGLQPPATTSNINWSTDGATLANLTLSSVGGENSIAIFCGGAGRTHVIVDVQGYVPFVP